MIKTAKNAKCPIPFHKPRASRGSQPPNMLLPAWPLWPPIPPMPMPSIPGMGGIPIPGMPPKLPKPPSGGKLAASLYPDMRYDQSISVSSAEAAGPCAVPEAGSKGGVIMGWGSVESAEGVVVWVRGTEMRWPDGASGSGRFSRRAWRRMSARSRRMARKPGRVYGFPDLTSSAS